MLKDGVIRDLLARLEKSNSSVSKADLEDLILGLDQIELKVGRRCRFADYFFFSLNKKIMHQNLKSRLLELCPGVGKGGRVPSPERVVVLHAETSSINL